MTNRRIAATIALAGGFLLMTGCGSGSDPGPSSATGGGLSSLTGMYAATDVTKDWTPNAAIVKGKPDGSVANLLSIAVAKDKVSFLVNGTEVYSAPAGSVDTDGIVGVRINHMLSIHVESLAVAKK